MSEADKFNDSVPEDVAGAREIDRYLASDGYQRRRVSTTHSARPPRISLVPPAAGSLLIGLAGLAALTAVLGVTVPLGIHLLNEFSVTRPTYPMMMGIVQTLFLPPMIGYSFAAVTPMFWYGSLLTRFVLAALTVIPGCLTCALAFEYTDGGPSDFYTGFIAVMFSAFMAIAAVALVVQLWTRWTLSHWREDSNAIPPMGIRSLIELTVIAAIGFTAFRLRDLSDYRLGLLLFSGIATFAAATIIAAQIGYFVIGRTRRIALTFALLLAFGGSFFVNGFFAVQEYGWTSLTAEAPYIGMVSLYGMLLTCGVTWLYLKWLHICKWHCVNRKEIRQRVEGG